MTENKTHQQKLNFSREPHAHYLEMATRMDKRRIIKDPDGYGKKTGECGDTVEMFLIVRKNRIHSVSFITDGCMNIHACANTVAFIAEGKTVAEAWEITPENVIDYLETLRGNGLAITLFPNNFKSEDKHPDYNMIFDAPYVPSEGGNAGNTVQKNGSAKAKATSPKKTNRFSD